MSKLRVGGETIDPKKQYSGSRVIELLNISYNNGYDSGKRECKESVHVAFTDGFRAGYREASADLMQLKELLNRLLGQQ